MENDMYPGMGNETSAGSDTPAPEGSEQSEGKDEMQGETALLPKTILGGKEFQPGEEVVLKIVHDHGDEIEVAYASEKPEGGGEEGGPEMDKADAKLGAMAY